MQTRVHSSRTARLPFHQAGAKAGPSQASRTLKQANNNKHMPKIIKQNLKH